MMISTKNYPMKGGICEKKDCYILSVSLPGIERENITTKVENGFLIISALAHENETSSKTTYQRSFYVGHSVTEDVMKSTYKRNTLKIIIPKNINEKQKSMAFA